MSTDPLEPLKNMGNALRAATEKLGLQMQGFMVVPDMHGTNHAIQAIFVIDEDVVGKTDEQIAEQDLFNNLERDMAHDEVKQKDQERLDAARENLLAMRKKYEAGESILGDDE